MADEGGNGGGQGGFVRADQIDLKSLDEQLQRHLSRAWTMEKNANNASSNGTTATTTSTNNNNNNFKKTEQAATKQEWEIDPSKLIIKSVIARGTFGIVHRGVYDGLDVAGKSHFLYVYLIYVLSFFYVYPIWELNHFGFSCFSMSSFRLLLLFYHLHCVESWSICKL